MAERTDSTMSEGIRRYFNQIEKETRDAFGLAKVARGKGKDPSLKVEIQLAEDLASRVEAMIGAKGIAKKIREQMKIKNSREEVALQISKETGANEFAKSGSVSIAIDKAVRSGLAVLTGGVLVAPIEGIAGVKIKRNSDGTRYVDLFFSGPIRSAGGTAQALTVLIADVVRRELGIGRYTPTKKEIERYKEEVSLYKQVASLQYSPSPEETEVIIRGCPVCIDGEPTESREVQGNRDLKRVETNRIRGGAMLVLAEGLCLKAPKLQKLVKRLNIQEWDFLGEALDEREKSKGKGTLGKNEVRPSAAYIKEIIAGRPVFAHPSREGGFCLRYGRARNSGFASVAVNPATMCLLDNFLAIGTQIKMERPGKSGTIASCEDVEGPTVLMNNGDLLQVSNLEEAKQIKSKVREITGVGEMLIPYGDFLENNVLLIPGKYSLEWWIQDLEDGLDVLPTEQTPEKIKEADDKAECILRERFDDVDVRQPSAEQAFAISSTFDVPLHPNYNLFWHDLTLEEVSELSQHIKEKGKYEEGKLVLPFEDSIKKLVIKLGALHLQRGDFLIFEKYAYPLIRGCGFDVDKGGIYEKRSFDQFANAEILTLDLVSKLSSVKIMPRCLTRIGARMGRPEKAAPRKMQPSPNLLFPVGNFGGKQRILQEAARNKETSLEIGLRKCKKCGLETYLFKCSRCGTHTYPPKRRIVKQEIDLSKELADAQENLGEFVLQKIKGVRGLVSESKTPEVLEKGILRSKQGVWVFKDGTVRFDQTNAPLTHFKPSETGTSIKKLKELGYTHDCFGEDLKDKDQLCELLPQDIILPLKGGKYLLASAKFVDDLLEKFYGLDRYYNAENLEDMVGQLVIGLSPHTSSGIVGRIIGFTRAGVGWAHPYFHASKRRNADGDEDAVMLLMDALLNFSQSYLPEKRGGKMDAPLILTTRINPLEVDEEVHNLDMLPRYPLTFYQATLRQAHPKDVEEKMRLVSTCLGTKDQYEGFYFTHQTSDIASGPLVSAYKTLESMEDKIRAQLELAKKIRAVDENDVASKLISSHFLRDLVGNMRTFSKQSFRCLNCNAKYRRVPLQGKCLKCGGKLTLTVHELSIKKYLDIAKELTQDYEVPFYLKQRLKLIEANLDSMFEKGRTKKTKITDFL